MKFRHIFTIVIITFLMFCNICYADDTEWTVEDTIRQVAYTAVHVADWSETRYISKNPDLFKETNPILGEHPSLAQVDTYFVTTLLAHTAISYLLEPPYREIWQYVTITIETGYTVHNINLGVRGGF